LDISECDTHITSGRYTSYLRIYKQRDGEIRRAKERYFAEVVKN
jgi:hypothetical protein